MAKAFRLVERLEALRAANRWRYRRTLGSPQGGRVVVDGREVLCFSSNDYLGLASHPEVIAACHRAIDLAGVGAGASHLVCGHHAFHQALEERLADFVGAPRAVLFSSGYAANLGVVAALLGHGDQVIEDKLNHASLLDAARLSGADLKRYRHVDLTALKMRLSNVSDEQHCLVVTDGVFSMDGDVAPVAQIAAACRSSGAWLMVDDAHGFGVLGPGGRGTLHAVNDTPHAVNDTPHVQVYMATLGKAVGVAGAFVAGDEALIDYLVQRSRTAIYTTAMPPALAAACLASLRLIESDAWRREHLFALINAFRTRAEAAGLPLLPSATAIQPVMVGDDRRAIMISHRLLENGFLVVAIRPPTVPEGTARLRVTLSAAHDVQHVLALVDAMAEAFHAYPEVTCDGD